MKNMEGLTEAQYKAIALLVWTDKGKQEIADEIGVHRVTLYRWYKEDDFMNELQKERRNKFVVYGDVATKELMKLVKDDSDKRTQLQAIKMILGENGLCSDKLQVENTTTTELKITLFDSEEEETEE
ncbi:MAG: phBC6A51 family helix-turn-helix protein [Sedimentibacter sp.]|uniref:phBC6A51 family helix-turn-helix protein n=1 Tax=Sedimentibacter sp. TaxID=1960295 RepID=UPI002980CAB5|nr:phBC6A51 family helix-turn-helix protein [Sedimentibacter sp.]MDW5300634.1 phBC6A51 family helix-turn-helix protein [Sedimentibacter sp.]